MNAVGIAFKNVLAVCAQATTTVVRPDTRPHPPMSRHAELSHRTLRSDLRRTRHQYL